MIITIDGPVATGKSHVARRLAQSIGFIFFDTGAMYRTLAYGIIKNKIDFHIEDQLKSFLEGFKLELKTLNHERNYFFEGENITKKIRESEVTRIVSEISAQKAVREKLIHIQRELSVGINAVFEGRDMGTVVFPDASLKIFLTGKNEIRAKRRFEELKAKFPEDAKNLTFEQCLEEINARDTYDSNREHSPLCQAPDAHVIDTSEMNIDDVVYRILEIKDSIKAKQFFSR